jgi:membrane protein implicated in regulation of membrane protease activity
VARSNEGVDGVTWVTEHPALAWLALALVLGAIEVATLSLFFIMLAAGAAAGAVAAGAGGPVVVQVVAAVVVALLLVALLRPALVRRMRQTPGTLTGTAALVGSAGRVLETVTETGGRVRLGGEVWSATTRRGALPDVIAPGQPVRVLAIEGATAVVAAEASEAGSS